MPSNTIHFAPISSFFALSMASMPLQVELAGLDHLGRQMRVQEKELALGQSGQAPIEGGGIGDDLLRAFLERDEDAGLLPQAGALTRD